jgi:hypothetical protein
VKPYIYEEPVKEGRSPGLLLRPSAAMERSNIWNGLDELAFYENAMILELLERSQGISSLSIHRFRPSFLLSFSSDERWRSSWKIRCCCFILEGRRIGGSLLVSGPDHVPARACCSRSPAWELAEDPFPRLALLPGRAARLQTPMRHSSCARTAQLVLARTSVTVAAEVGIAIVQATLIARLSIIAACCC